jgi:tetratricopeptide (TPR) repeat protein
MASRLLEQLDRAIALEYDPYRRECWKAQRAAAAARLGMISEAKFALAGLRTQARRFRDPLLQGWIHLADGMIDHFSTLSHAALKKFAVAKDEALKAGNNSLQSQAWAWMASVAFNTSQFKDMAEALRQSFLLATPDDHAALARANVTLGNAQSYAGLYDRGLKSFGEAHQHAVAEGDTGMISVMMCNRTRWMADGLTYDELLGHLRLEDAQRALIDNESIVNLDRGLGNESLGAVAPLMRGQLLVTLQRWGDALSWLDTYLERARTEGFVQNAARYSAQRAWCNWHLQNRDSALADAAEAARTLAQPMDLADRFVAHARLAGMFGLAGQAERSAEHRALSDQALREFRAEQELLTHTLADLDVALQA